MTKLIELTEQFENIFSDIPEFEAVYNDGEDGNDCEDDGYLHVNFKGNRFVFYNGQGKGQLREKQLSKYKKIVAQRIIRR